MGSTVKKVTIRPASQQRAEAHGEPVSGQSFHFKDLELKAAPAGAWLAESGGLRGKKQLSGSITMFYTYRSPVTGNSREMDCGTWPATSLRDIRRARDDYKRKVAEGIDPKEVVRQARAAAPAAAELERIRLEAELEQIRASQAAEAALDLTIKDLFNDWIKRGVKRADGNTALCQMFNKHILPSIGHLAIRHLLKDSITDLLNGIVAQGMNRTAVTVKDGLTQMFNWADHEQPWRKLLAEHGIPTRRIDMDLILDADYEEERARVLSDSELTELSGILRSMTQKYADTPAGQRYGSVRPLQPTHQLAIWICLSTLCRIGELTSSEWRHVDLERSPPEFFLPMANTKGARGKKQDHMIFLSPFAERLFRQLHQITGHSPFLFPNAKGDGPVIPKSVSQSIKSRQIMFRKGASERPGSRRQENNSLVLGGGKDGKWTPHDMRRTGATMMQRLGIDPELIDRCQNHVVATGKTKIRRHYQRYQYQQQKTEAWAKLGAELERIIATPAESVEALARACNPDDVTVQFS